MSAAIHSSEQPGTTETQFARLVTALRESGRYAGRPERVDLLETHISCVLLAGDYAYKIKKPVNLGFLDFTSLAARRFYCEEEVRLNGRTAPALYLDVVPITGSVAEPVIGGTGPPIEYAVRMRRFSQDALLDHMARNRTLTADCVDALGLRVAEFHRGLASSGADCAYASSAQVLAAALQNFEQIQALAGNDANGEALAVLRRWTVREHTALAGVFDARKCDGFVRECHGDLHLGNIVMQDADAVPFDCIEFNAAFRWIDVMSEVAFLAMDLEEHRLPQLAYRFLNRYLEASGDYAGLAVLRFYVVYRALIRAKVACIRGQQTGIGVKAMARAAEEFAHYLDFAQKVANAERSGLVIMHGLPGSGKSTLARHLADALLAVRLRSDVERKRLHGLAPQARTASPLEKGIYTPANTDRTYMRLAGFAAHAIAAGYPVIVDAACPAASQRELFRRLARDTGVPFAIASCAAPEEVLRARVARREAQGEDASDAGVAVLESQLATREPLAGDETRDAIPIDTSDSANAWQDAADALTLCFERKPR